MRLTLKTGSFIRGPSLISPDFVLKELRYDWFRGTIGFVMENGSRMTGWIKNGNLQY